MPDTSAPLVYEEARRLLTRQESDLDTLRTRTLTMLTAAALVAGLFGGRVASNGCETRSLVVLALVAFGLTVAGALWIVWPVKFHFSHGLDPWIAAMEKGEPLPADAYYFNISRDLQDYRRMNQKKIGRRYWVFSALCFLVGAQVILWAAAVL